MVLDSDLLLTGRVQRRFSRMYFYHVSLSTVLAQDRFFSVSLSFTLDKQSVMFLRGS